MCQREKKDEGLLPLFRLDIWPGYVTSVDEFEGGLQLQVDVSHRVGGAGCLKREVNNETFEYFCVCLMF